MVRCVLPEYVMSNWDMLEARALEVGAAAASVNSTRPGHSYNPGTLCRFPLHPGQKLRSARAEVMRARDTGVEKLIVSDGTVEDRLERKLGLRHLTTGFTLHTSTQR